MAHARRVPKTAPGESHSLVNIEMETLNIRLSRISKIHVDRDALTSQDALARRELYGITLRCGPDVEQSRTLQLAVLTAANIANRCFPGAVKIVLGPGLEEAPLLLWPSLEQTFGQALVRLLGPDTLRRSNTVGQDGRTLLFGNAPTTRGALRVTFDGWIAKVGPAAAIAALPQREFCSLSGVLAGALAISELFLSFADLNIEASRRTVGLSLWRPELNICDPLALGIQVEFLPRDLWLLGLGHLGNAYLWSLATLPYPESAAREIFLNDFDRVEPELAGKSVAVPFVGAAAATFVVAAALRILHGGPAYTDTKLVLSDLSRRFARTTGNYSVQDLAGVNYCDASVAW